MKKLVAEDGKVYTNGETFGSTVCLPDGADEEAWTQVSAEEAAAMTAEADGGDKDAALRRFGVEVDK